MSQSKTPLTIEYSLDEQDCLTYQLYAASKSPRITKKRKRNKITVPLFYGVVAVFFYTQQNISGFILFLALGTGWYIYYAKWEKNVYLKHYKKYVKEVCQNQIGVITTLAFHDEFIFASDAGNESKIMNSEINSFVEIPTLILVQLKSGQAFAIPKSRLENLQDTIVQLKQAASNASVPYRVENDWVWK